MSYKRTQHNIPLIGGKEKTFRKVYGGQCKRLSWGQILIEEVRRDRAGIIIANEDEEAEVKRWKILAVGGDWYPYQGVQIPFLHQVGEEVVLAHGTTISALPETGEGYDTPTRGIVMMPQVLYAAEPLSDTEQGDAN